MDNLSGRTMAIIAYLTFVGLIIAYFLNKETKDAFATWHIKNMFGLVLLLFVSIVLQDSFIGFYIYWTAAILWVLCLILAMLNKQQGIPYLSEKFQTWFTFLD